MVNTLIETISVILLIGASILMFLWQKKFENSAKKLIKSIGITVLIIGFYKLLSLLFNVFSVEITISAFDSIIEFGGFAYLMFSLFNYLEEKK